MSPADTEKTPTGAETALSRPGAALLWVTVGSAALAGGVLLVATLFMSVAILSSDAADGNGTDPNVIYQIQQMLSGRKLYTPPDQPPFAVTQYSPAYYYASFAAANLLGASGDDPVNVTRVARGVSMIFGVAGAAVLFLGARFGLRLAIPASLAAATMYWACVVPWPLFSRVDSTEAVLVFAAVLLGIPRADGRSRSTRRWVVVGTIAAAAVLAKQSGVQAVAIVGIWLLLRREWKTLTIVSATFAGVLIALVAILYAIYGPALVANVIDGVRQPIYTPGGVRFIKDYGARIAPAGLAMVLGATISRDPRLLYVTTAAVVASIFAVDVSFKQGSALSYCFIAAGFTSLAAVAALLGPLPAMAAETSRRTAKLLAGAAVAVLVLFQSIPAFIRLIPDTFTRLNDPLNRYDTLGQSRTWLAERLSANPNTFFWSTDRRLSCLFPTRSFGAQYELLRFGATGNLIDFSNLKARAADGTLAIFVSRLDAIPESMACWRSVIGGHLTEIGRTDQHVFYAPKR
jgi:hypothetical protein